MMTKRWMQNAIQEVSTSKHYQGLKNTFDMIYNKEVTHRKESINQANKV
jgi:hypothetical protein